MTASALPEFILEDGVHMALPFAIHGTIIHSVSVQEVEIIEQGLLVVSRDGKIALLQRGVAKDDIIGILSGHGFNAKSLLLRVLKHGEFLIPGFIDTHNHAPQWTQRGTGRGRLIMDWLSTVTFPHEARFADAEYAKKTYADCVDGFIKQGITTASYYGFLHGEATKILAETCLRKGQRALVGKCNMNISSPDIYKDASAEESLQVTEDFIAHVRKIDPKSELVTPILTPRFAVACDHDVLRGLGKIAAKNPDLPIQTHFDETLQEMEITKELYPEFSNEAHLYEHFGLLNERSILAHCIYVDEYEMGRLKDLNCGVAHCPVSNTTGGGFGAAPIREYLRRDIKVGLGTTMEAVTLRQ
jgi:guanine deaminase